MNEMLATCCNSSSSSEDENNLEKAAAFMGGFVFLFPLYVVVNFSSFAVTRFHLPPDKIPLFINKFFSSMQICCLIGMLIMCGCVLAFEDKMNYISIVSMFLLFISILVLWITYNSGGQLGRLTLYYWTVNLVGFVVGLNNISISKVATKEVLFITFGRTISGIVIVIYQMTVYYTCLRLRVQNIGFWMYNLFMVMLLTASYVTAMVWTAAFCHNGSSGGSKEKDGISDLKKPEALSPFFMFPISMIITYAFNPAIAPYQFLGLVDGYKVSLFVTGVSCIPAIVFIILEFRCSNNTPNNKWDNGKKWYHLTWVTILPMLLSAFICLIMLHYPDCPLSRKFYKSKFLIFLLSVTFLFGNDICITVGLAGATHQGSGSTQAQQSKGGTGCNSEENGEKKSNGVIAAVNLCLSYLVMVISMFISDGYLKTYRKYDRDYWPTKGYTRYRGFKFWFTAGLKEAGKTVRNSFTLDIRLQFTRHMV